MALPLRSPESCAFDCISLGEVMLRLDPGEGRIRTAREFRVWEGGGEYNVSRGLRRCFGLRTALVSAFADNDVGRLLEDLILQGGVDQRFVQWKPFDGIGREVRNGLNFTERGFGVRGARGTSDRGSTAASQMKPGDVDWDDVFGRHGSRWFHTGGIFAALSETAAEVAIEACRKAREHGTIVSYDLNYRPSLWKSIGGRERAREVNREIAQYVDVMIGIEEGNEAEDFKQKLERTIAEFPNLKAAATTLRKVHSATVNDWGAMCWHEGACHEAVQRPRLEILDRVGAGDSFAAGLIYGFLVFNDAAKAVEYGAAHGALAMTTPGDTSMATLSEVEQLVRGADARVDR